MAQRPPDNPRSAIVVPMGPDAATSLAGMPLSSFLGRSDEVDAVLSLVRQPEVRLVTITGPGGAGKTRLARRVMDIATAEGFPGIFVSLASIRQPGLILTAIAGAIGMPEQPGQPLDIAVHHAFGTGPVLLILDNLEHLLDEAATTIHGLLHACPDLTVLGTSRARLGLSGEHLFPLAGLNPEEARSLFVARAQAIRHDPVVTTSDVPIIDAICDRVDRLPLGIELAAARTSVLPLPALRDRLERRLDLLTGGPRDAPGRQQTMRSAIAWSHDLLTEQEQRLYRRLGVFVGGFTLDAVQAVAADGHATLDEIAALTAASLVIPMATQADEPRYTMLETIREFALEQLMSHGEEDAARSALLQHLTDIAEQMWNAPTGLELEACLARSVRDIANIRTSLAWAVDHDPVQAIRLVSAAFDLWNYHTGAAEGRHWLERSLASAPDLSPPLQARQLLVSGALTRSLGYPTQAVENLSEAVAIAVANNETRLLNIASGLLAEAHRERGDMDLARAAQEVEWSTAEALGEPLALAIATLNRGQAALDSHNYPRAQELFKEAVTSHQQSGSDLGVAIARSWLAEAMLADGEIAGAAEPARQAIRGFAAAAAWVQVSSDLIRLARLTTTSEPEISVQLLAAAVSILDTAGITPLPEDEGTIDRTTTQARITLGEAAFDIAWESGSRLDLEDVFKVVDEAVLAITQPIVPPSHGLSPRETEVLRLVAAGKSNRAIAGDLSISERTVENHVFHILAKLELDSRTAAATWAVRHNLA